MGTDQDLNWCVTKPWFDYLLGTRVDYAYDARGRVVKEKASPAMPAESTGLHAGNPDNDQRVLAKKEAV